jgi:hypothetical protein
VLIRDTTDRQGRRTRRRCGRLGSIHPTPEAATGGEHPVCAGFRSRVRLRASGGPFGMKILGLFLGRPDLDESADVLEVVRALVSEIGLDPERNSGFDQRYMWSGNANQLGPRRVRVRWPPQRSAMVLSPEGERGLAVQPLTV